MPLACQVAASVFLDLTIIRGGIEMEIELVTIGVQPVGIVSLKDGASRPPGFLMSLGPFALLTHSPGSWRS